MDIASKTLCSSHVSSSRTGARRTFVSENWFHTRPGIVSKILV